MNAPFLSPDKEDEGRTFKVLDYACGTGNVSRALAPYASQVVGFDLSPAMTHVYNQIAENQGLTEDEMHAYVANIIEDADTTPAELKGPKFQNFNLAIVGLGFHHFEDPERSAKRLAERLEDGGVLAIIDFLPHTHSHNHHGHNHHGHDGEGKAVAGDEEMERVKKTIVHSGFSEDTTRDIFQAAGCGKDFAYKSVGKGFVIGSDNSKERREVFIARGTKATP
jgi:SAM-dependent methyltransferase